MSQGASKFVYYVGGFLLFFLPGLHLTRGGLAAMTNTLFTPDTPQLYFTKSVTVRFSVTVHLKSPPMAPRYIPLLKGSKRQPAAFPRGHETISPIMTLTCANIDPDTYTKA